MTLQNSASTQESYHIVPARAGTAQTFVVSTADGARLGQQSEVPRDEEWHVQH
ncbi:hypothetical protein [Streptomyces sp. B21-083]|uniref:hypothetical protein n=1 Tax=Streptomyces sp. B21-083 TaxID=3039410 RepID=UPI002FF21D44